MTSVYVCVFSGAGCFPADRRTHSYLGNDNQAAAPPREERAVQCEERKHLANEHHTSENITAQRAGETSATRALTTRGKQPRAVRKTGRKLQLQLKGEA